MRNITMFILFGIVGYILICLGHSKKNYYVSLFGIFVSITFFIMLLSVFL